MTKPPLYDFALNNFHSASHVAQGYSAFFSLKSRQLGGQNSPTIVYTTQNIPSGVTVANAGDYFGNYAFKVTASSAVAPGKLLVSGDRHCGRENPFDSSAACG